MTKYEMASEDVESLFDEVRDKTTIPQWVEFRVLCNNKMKKEVTKIVKSNEITELLSEGVNFVVIINEEIFNNLPSNMKIMELDEKLAGICVSDSDALSIEKPDFNSYMGVLEKYGDSEIIKLKESIKSLFDKKKEEENREKAEKAAKRKERKKEL